MTDSELAELTIEDRNRILDAYRIENATDLEFKGDEVWNLPIFGWAWSEARAELDHEYSLLDEGPLPGYDAYDMANDR